jgi:DNA-binding response OmpR family regulator
MSNASILFVEDELSVLNSLLRFFQKQGYQTYGAQTPVAALEILQNNHLDIAIMDVMLHESGGGTGEVDGFELCRQFRSNGFNKPIIFVSARSLEEDKLLGFEMGADDYVTKPFSLPELLARVNANLRRSKPAHAVVYYEPDVCVKLDMHEIHHGIGDAVSIEQLSKRERDLLAFFIANTGKIVSREQLLQEVWGYRGGVHTRTVDTHVLTVRKKLRDNIQQPVFIQTLHGVGYKFIATPVQNSTT